MRSSKVTARSAEAIAALVRRLTQTHVGDGQLLEVLGVLGAGPGGVVRLERVGQVAKAHVRGAPVAVDHRPQHGADRAVLGKRRGAVEVEQGRGQASGDVVRLAQEVAGPRGLLGRVNQGDEVEGDQAVFDGFVGAVLEQACLAAHAQVPGAFARRGEQGLHLVEVRLRGGGVTQAEL
jgi:hypothetical protein